MLDEYGFEIYEENAFPIAYLLTFRTYGSWIHGDKRGSHQRSRDKRSGTIKLEPNVPLTEAMKSEMKGRVVILNRAQRRTVELAIKDVCQHRGYLLRALNVRTNHIHVVVSKGIKPEKIVNDLKAYATRRLREQELISPNEKVWSRGASTRYLWKPRHVDAAVDYVLFSQGDKPFGTVFDIS